MLFMLIQIRLETSTREGLLSTMCLPLEEVLLVGRLLYSLQLHYLPLRQNLWKL